MELFYSNVKVTRILGLTVSPIKSKLAVTTLKHEIRQRLQELADNLYSRFIAISEEELEAMKSDC